MADKLIDDLKKRMEGSMASLHKDLKGLRTGRANSALLEGVVVEAYGSKMALDQVATVNVADARMLTVQVWDKANASAVEKGILNAGLGLNPMVDGQLIRVPLPSLSEERRKELVKAVHQYAEKAKIAIRNVRRDGMDDLKKMEKDGSLSKDQLHGKSEEIQKVTDEYTKNVDAAIALKEKDIMNV